MDGSWTEFAIQLLALLAVLGVSLLLILPRILEKVVVEKLKHKNQVSLTETDSSLEMYRDVLNNAKGLSPWLRERMMLRAFPLLEGPDKARAAL